MKHHQWFTKITPEGQTINRLRIMQPIAPKYDHQVAEAEERLEERGWELTGEDGEVKAPKKCKVSALKHVSLGDIKNHVDLKEHEWRTRGDEECYPDVRQTINGRSKKEKIKSRIWIAGKLQEERKWIQHLAAHPTEDIGQMTQDGRKEI